MGKLEKLEKLQKLKENGTITEQEFNAEKEKLMNNKSTNNKKTKVIIAVIIILILITGGAFAVYYFTNNKSAETSSNSSNKTETKEDGFEQESANIYANGTDNVSFANMSGDDKNLSNEQKEIVYYFDNNYFGAMNTESLQRYPQIFKNAKICMNFGIHKVLKSTEHEFEALVYAEAELFDGVYEDADIKDIPQDILFVIKGPQMEERLLENDHAEVYGRYIDVQEYVIDGVTYNLPTVNIINIVQEEKYNIDTITTVAKKIFGNNIKVTTLGDDEYLEMEAYLSRGMQSSGYRVTLDNQSNANFKSFVMDAEDGMIVYDWKLDDFSDNVIKKLFVSADFQHYIVSTYDKELKHVYIEYFDNQYNKLWSREFDYNSTKEYTSPIDYTDKQMAVVVDNELYLIDLETGENVIEPVLVGEKERINMMSDGIVLITDDNKDTIMKVGYDGKIIFKTNGDLKLKTIVGINTQIVNGKLVVSLYGSTSEGLYRNQYLVVNNDGKLEMSTNVW